MVNYLAISTQPDIIFTVHESARFSVDPRLSHERAIKRIVRDQKGTPEGGIVSKLYPTEGVKCYVDFLHVAIVMRPMMTQLY